jgi:hypothetical protein
VIGSHAEPKVRIRDLLTKPAGIWAESTLTEPTGYDYAVTNFIPLPITHFNPFPEAATRPLRECC